MEKEKAFNTGPQWTANKVIGVSWILYNAGILTLLLYNQFQLSSMKEHYDYRFEEVEKKLEFCQSQVSVPHEETTTGPFQLNDKWASDLVNLILNPQNKLSDRSADRTKREILSANKIDLSTLLKGRDGRDGIPGHPGVQGPPGQPGKDGLPGKDAVNIAFVKHFINATVTEMASVEINKLKQVAKNIPAISGATFIRWGRTVCPSKSTIIYRGRAGGPNFQQPGGSPTLLCMPEDPEYSPTAPDGVSAYINGVEYHQTSALNHVSGHYHNAPCTVCQTPGRISLSTFPAKLRCPDDSWTKEYSGFLMTEHASNPGGVQYVCVDQDAEALPGMQAYEHGALLRTVGVQCKPGTASGNFGLCPPYKQESPVTCSVCSK